MYVKPTHLCRLEIKPEDANDDKGHEPHPDVKNVDKKAKDKHLRENAVRGIKMLMNEDVDVSKMEKKDWEYLRRISVIPKKLSDSQHCEREKLDQSIQNIINEIQDRVLRQQNQGNEA